MEKHLITVADKDPAVAYDIVQDLTNRMRVNPDFAEREKAAPATNDRMEVELDTHIVDGLRHFMNYHKTCGTIPLEQRNALDTVQVAACFADPKNLSTSMISQPLGVRWEAMEKSRECAGSLQKNETKFCSLEIKVRMDCYRDEAALSIDAIYHSEEGSWVDNESKRIYKIKNPATSMVESHPA
jgi:hypothetical protein